MSNKPDFSKELSGRRALVTGGTRGNGAAIAQRLLEAGAKVVVAARAPNDDAPAAATFAAGDVSTSEGVEAVATQALAALGGLDILVNNAGGGRAFLEGSWTIPDQAWHDSFALNLFAAVRLTNAVLPALRASQAAAVVNISSAAATMPFGPFAHYGAAKAALEYYSRTLAMELAPSGIRVNVVSPGVIATPGSAEFARTTPGFSTDDWVRNIPLGRIGATEDIAEVVALLVSERGKFLTGANYRVDGGMTARWRMCASNMQFPVSVQLQPRIHDMNRLNGKTAVITGGATGIGRAAAKRFIEEGAFVFIFGRRQEALDAAVADLGPHARAVQGSVSDLADLDRLYAAVKAERGTLDIVFANAGTGSLLPLGEITAEQIDETFDTNVKGTIFTVQKALPLMGVGGSIILTGSSAGTTGAPAFSAYSASKAVVRNLAKTWAEDLKGTGIRVNVLSPGPTATELAKAAVAEAGMQAFASMNPLQRMAEPSEIGAAAAFLASADSSFMTASELAVDGGLAQI